MAILINENTRLIVQGITGRDGSFHAQQMLDYDTKVVAGVTPGKGGSDVHGIPVFNTVRQAIEKTGANTSIIFVPAQFAPDAIYEAADAELDLVVCIAEGIPTLDMIKIVNYLKETKTRLVGPNSAGIISPGLSKVGIPPAMAFSKGKVGIVSRSGTLTYEIASHITRAGYGESTVIGIGGDPIIGTNFIDCLQLFEKDKETKAIVIIGEIGGTDEEKAAEYVSKNITKPIFGFIAGQSAPADKRMGHAGAIIAGGKGTAKDKIEAFEKVGITVIYEPEEITQKLNLTLK
ncbi:MAG: succinate--CoA ligase subunit alpha [Candidatus Latescibacteria bacterium]|nr:succinate--CoA ligase subunit alpha [Candidatus Latescibacterota bacterium]